jgi:hypothetical protein
MIKHSLTLNYQLNPGWLAPYIERLKEGILLAWQCASCSQTRVPSTRRCTCGSSDGCWITLSGTAHIVKRTTGLDGDFALVRFEGADTLTVVALERVCASATTAVIKPINETLPQLILVAAAAKKQNDIDQ